MAPTVGSIPALHLSYGNRVLALIGERGPGPLDALIASVDVETLFKSDRAHRDPRGRIGALVRFAKGVGLVAEDEEGLRLTESGRRYVGHADRDDPFATSDMQARVLRTQIASYESPLLDGARLALSLLATASLPVAPEDLGRALAAVGEKTEWRAQRTVSSQGERFAAFLEDAGTIERGGRLTDAGRAVLDEIEAPAHPALDELLAASLPPDVPIHLVLKWASKYGEDTIERHRELAESHGEVWWSVRGTQGSRGMSQRALRSFHAQLSSGLRTNVYLYGPTCWTTQMVAIQDHPPPSSERQLIAKGASPNEHTLWVKLRDFAPVERKQLERALVLDSDPSKPIGPYGDRRFSIVRQAFRELDEAPDVEAEPPVTRRTWRTSDPDAPTVWWVNQGNGYESQRDGGHVWIADDDVAGLRDQLRAARLGDRTVHCTDEEIRAVGTVTGKATAGRRSPDDRTFGLLLPVAYDELPEPIDVDEIPASWSSEYGVRWWNRFTELSPALVRQLDERFPQLTPGAALPPAAPPRPVSPSYDEPELATIEAHVTGQGMQIDARTLRRYHLALKTRGFVILSGVSGTGKTWLTQLYADAADAEYELVPVAPSWTTNEELLGYLNPFTGKYQHTAFSRFVLAAAAEHRHALAEGRVPRPFHLVLDEMNLARVEHYFAKFLSAMELRARDGTTPVELAPGSDVALTPNLHFVGTVNVDETTHGFADKIFDRAQLLEIDLTREGIESHLAEVGYRDELLAIWDAVAAVAPFAYRTLDEIVAYVDAAGELGTDLGEALDEQVLQKVLPRLGGADPRVGEALLALHEISTETYPLSASKLERMLLGVERHGFASYF